MGDYGCIVGHGYNWFHIIEYDSKIEYGLYMLPYNKIDRIEPFAAWHYSIYTSTRLQMVCYCQFCYMVAYDSFGCLTLHTVVYNCLWFHIF